MEHRHGDVIVAPATASGRSAVAMLRLSGPAAALDLVQAALVRSSLAHRALTPCSIWDGGQRIDRGMAVRFVGPVSATGEDVLELHLHGNPRLVERALDAACRAGARLAAPGEFSRRALRHGKLDLVQAEALDALIRAESADAAALAAAQLDGGLTRRLSELRASLLDVAAALEAAVDFPDEVEPVELEGPLGALGALQAAVAVLARDCGASRGWLDAPRVALVGPVNAGKSSLFNALLAMKRAIVSPAAGTTRDVVSETVVWSGLALRLEDTAGARQTDDPIEQEGVRRAQERAVAATLRVEVRDGRDAGDGGDRRVAPTGARDPAAAGGVVEGHAPPDAGPEGLQDAAGGIRSFHDGAAPREGGRTERRRADAGVRAGGDDAGQPVAEPVVEATDSAGGGEPARRLVACDARRQDSDGTRAGTDDDSLADGSPPRGRSFEAAGPCETDGLDPGAAAALRVATHRDQLDATAIAALCTDGWIVVDARAGAVDDVRRAIEEALRARPLPTALLHTERQRRCVERAAAALDAARAASSAEPAVAAVEVRIAGEALAELVGEWTDEVVLDALFARFCIGK